MPPARSPQPLRSPNRAWLAAALLAVLSVGLLVGLSGSAWAGASGYPEETTAAPTSTAEPGPSPTLTDPDETDPPEPSPSEVSPTEPDPTPTQTPTPTPSPTTTSPSPVPSATTSRPPATTAPRPPAIAEADLNPTSWIIALLALLLGAVVVLLLVRRPASATAGAGVAVAPGALPPSIGGTTQRLASLEAVGEAMLDAGYSVTGVRSALEDIAAVNGLPDTEIVVFPTALLVSSRDVGEMHTAAATTGERPLMLNQIDALDDVVRQARSDPGDPVATAAAVAAVRMLPKPYSTVQRLVAHALLSGSLAVLLGASWTGIPVAMVLGALVGALLLFTKDSSRTHNALVTVASAFVVSTTVFVVTGAGLEPGVLAAMIAPLATLLPGGLLTTGVIELATGQMMSGAGRLAGGAMQLVLLSAGVLAGATLVGVPALTFDEADYPLGPVAPWLAVAVFGASMVIYRCGRRASIPWVLVVLYVAYGAQVIGDMFFGGILSAMIGALAMTPVAYLVSTRRSGPAAFTSFLPAFWMLVPGALGLVGVASLMGGDSAGFTTLVTTAGTMVAITLGILVGSIIGARLAGRQTAVAV